MPEGPEVETIRRTLENEVRGQIIESIWRSAFALRTPTDSETFRFLNGDRIQTLSRTGKILLIETEQARGIFVQFGMSGKLQWTASDTELEKHTHLRIKLRDCDQELRFVDPRRFGDVKPFQSAAVRNQLLAQIGPDGIQLSKEQMRETAKRIRKCNRPIKTILLDQAMISGVGNIYACEALHLAKISPESLGSSLALREIESILSACKQVMNAAVLNKGTTFRSYVDGNGEKGGNQNHLRVFAKEKEPCPVCGKTIIRIVQSGRSTFYCKKCQA